VRVDLRGGAVQRQMAHRHAAIAGDVQAELDPLDVLAPALGAAVGGQGDRGLLALGSLEILVGPVEFDVGDVGGDLMDVELELLDGLEGQGGLDRLGVAGEPLQGATEPIIIELGSGQVVVVGHGGDLGPLADAEEGLGPEEPVGDEDLDEGAPGDFPLPRDESIDGGGQVELVEVGGERRQGADDLGLVLDRSIHGAASWELGSPGFAGAATAMPSPRLKTCPEGCGT
jgi:hypothetical protein